MVNRHIEAIIVTLLYFICLYFWILPIQGNSFPYGEVDAASHFAIADYTTSTNKPITILPFYIDKRYGRDNAYKNHRLWYHPPYHMAFSIAQIISNDRITSVFFANAIFSSLIVLSVYFIIRKLFGFLPAFLSSFMLIFSMRDIMVYLWGQWPERMGFAYLPLVIYCFYKYSLSYLHKKEKPIYLYLTSLLLVCNLFVHPMTFIHTILTLLIFSFLLLIKEKKLFFSIRHLLISVILFILIVSIFPLQTLNVIVRLKSNKYDKAEPNSFSRLFRWTGGLNAEGSVPNAYFSYKDMIGGYWTIPLIILGILVILLRRNNKTVIIFSWLIGLYIMIHLDVIGISGRVHRSLSATAHIFYPLVAIGLLSLVSYAKYFGIYKKYVKYGVILVFLVLFINSNGKAAYLQLKNAYSGIIRVTPYQLEVSEWIKDNIPEKAQIPSFGALTQAKSRWIWMLSHRYVPYIQSFSDKRMVNATHILLDYSDRAIIGDKKTIAYMQDWERKNLANATLLYNKNYIKVYKIGNQI